MPSLDHYIGRNVTGHKETKDGWQFELDGDIKFRQMQKTPKLPKDFGGSFLMIEMSTDEYRLHFGSVDKQGIPHYDHTLKIKPDRFQFFDPVYGKWFFAHLPASEPEVLDDPWTDVPEEPPEPPEASEEPEPASTTSET